MSEFVDNLKEVFEPFGRVQARKMFGGYGLFHEGLMIGLVADEVLYLKADAASAVYFTELGLAPFAYPKGDRTITMSYYMAPEAIFDDPDAARLWAVRAFEAALRSRKRGGASR